MQRKMSTNLVLLSVFIVFGLVACRPAPAPVPNPFGDGGLLSGEPCGPPCFWNIRPGETTKDQAVKILQEKHEFEQCKYFDNTSFSGLRGYNCRWVSFTLFNQKDIVETIGYEVTGGTQVKDLIEKYGPPDRLLSSLGGITDRRAEMLLLYDNLLMTVFLESQPSGDYALKPETKLESVSYSEKTSYEQYAKNYKTPWSGYVQYKPEIY